jgi:glutamate-1-semialdehyde 2,1-aminomutase
MTLGTMRSQELYEQVRDRVPGGVHSNTRARAPHPLYFRQATGPYLIDIDDNRYTDFVCGNGAIILGHGDPEVTAAVRAALADGVTTGSETRWSVQAAELLLACVPTAEMVRFANSGTEAVIHALEIARAVTGRNRIAKVEGAYHGWHSDVYVSAWPDLSQAGPAERPLPVVTHRGADAEQSRRTLILPFNDLEATRKLLADHGHELAALIIEPVMMDVGYIEATQEYIDTLRELTAKQGILLIFDELLTGFRVMPGGAQEYYGVTPDLSTFGKAIANGYPLACVTGRRDFLMASAPGGACAWVGTYNAHTVSMAAAVASLTKLQEPRTWARLQELTEYLEVTFVRRASQLGIPAILRGRGGNFHWYFAAGPVTDYRTAAAANREMHAAFAARALERGVWLSAGALSHHSLTLAHDRAHLDRFSDCLGDQ